MCVDVAVQRQLEKVPSICLKSWAEFEGAPPPSETPRRQYCAPRRQYSSRRRQYCAPRRQNCAPRQTVVPLCWEHSQATADGKPLRCAAYCAARAQAFWQLPWQAVLLYVSAALSTIMTEKQERLRELTLLNYCFNSYSAGLNPLITFLLIKEKSYSMYKCFST